MMESQQFYQRLREQDQPRVVELVEQMKERRFEVYATGSSLSRADYRDIDLVVTPQNLSEQIELLNLSYARGKLDQAILSFLERAVQNEEIVSAIPFNSASARVEATYNFSTITKQRTYAHSGVSERRKIEFRGTTIDITLTQTPFWQNPSAERVKL